MTKNRRVEEIEIDMSKTPDRQFWDRFWLDKHGNFVVWQKPNIYLIVWFVSFLIYQLFHAPAIRVPFSWIAFGAIIIWSILEMKSGVNYFRRFMGLLVFLLVILIKF